MIRVLPKKSKSSIRAKVQMMHGTELIEGQPYRPEVMFIQVFNEKSKKLQNYVIHEHQWQFMKAILEKNPSITPMEALISSWAEYKSDTQKLKFLNTVCKLLSIWGFIDIRPNGFKTKIFSKENTLEWIGILSKEEFDAKEIELPYTLEELIKYLRDSNTNETLEEGV